MAKMEKTADNKEPVRLSASSDVEQERKPLFYIDETEYSILAKPRPSIALKYMWNLRSGKSAEECNAALLIDMVGEEGYQALMNCDDITPDQLDQIFTIASDTAMSGMSDVGGNS